MIEKTTNTHRFGKLLILAHPDFLILAHPDFLILAHPDSVGLKEAVFDGKGAYS
jgi:hypothetical protein